MNHIARVMCLVVAVVSMPRMAEASGEKAAPAELSELAAWQAESPDAVAFEGGDAGGTLLFILVIVAIAALVYFLMDHGHHALKSPMDAAPVPAPAPVVFR
jgi:hypothetical protein